MGPEVAQVTYLFAWGAFAICHSWLAGATAKDSYGRRLGPYYRLAYNILAVVQLIALIGFGAWAFQGGRPIEPFASWRLVLTIIAVAGWTIMILALRTYDLGRFAGTTQIREWRETGRWNDEEALNTSGFHAYVRHPIYAAGFLILWGAAWTDFALATAVWGTLYLIIGARFEERRLARLHGDAYRDYKRQVPAFIPWKGRAI